MTGRALRLELPLPPSVNNIYCQAAGGRRVLTKKARRWKKQAAAVNGGVISGQRGGAKAGQFR
jgi:hypothetical protein